MNKAIKAIHYAGLTLADFRRLSKADRIFLWVMVVATCAWTD